MVIVRDDFLMSHVWSSARNAALHLELEGLDGNEKLKSRNI
jgi:hypothetical protein